MEKELDIINLSRDWVTDPYEIFLGAYRHYELFCGNALAQVQEKKAKGGKRPFNVSRGDWNGPFRFTPRLQKMCELLVAGKSLIDISEQFGISINRLWIIYSCSHCRKYIKELIIASVKKP